MGTEFQTGVGSDADGETAGRTAAQQALDSIQGDTVDFAVVFCSPNYDYGDVLNGVESVIGDAPLVGATAHGKFTERGVHTSAFGEQPGVIISLIATDEMRFFTGIGRNVSDDVETSVAEAAADLPTEVEGYPHLTGLLLSSSPFGREELAHITYQHIPIEWGGGGANDPGFEEFRVFHNGLIAPDAVVLTVIASKHPIALGVGNRHAPIGKSVTVTKSEGTLVHEFDGEPAYDVWKDVFDETARERYGFTMDDIEHDRLSMFHAFSEMVFGIKAGEDRYKIRSPVPTVMCEPYTSMGLDETDESGEDPFAGYPTLGSIPEGSLRFVEPIPEGVVLHAMTSGREGTIERGTKSAQNALSAIGDSNVAGGLVFECPCGEATLQEEYHKLVDAIVEPVNAPIAGIQSGGGEVCFRLDDMRGLHHTSTTMMLFPEGGTA